MVDQALITNDYGEPAIGAFARFGGSPQDVIAPWLVVQPDAQFFFAPRSRAATRMPSASR